MIDEETSLLSTTTVGKSPREGFDFFPLTVDVEERQYAAGKIPGSFFRREGRPPTDAILTARLIDRPLRPSFADGIRNERSEEHTSELQSRGHLVCRLLLEKKK